MVIVPVVRVSLPIFGGYALVKGTSDAVRVCEILQPDLFIPLMNNQTESNGILGTLLKSDGSLNEFIEKVRGIRGLQDMKVLKEVEEYGPNVGIELTEKLN